MERSEAIDIIRKNWPKDIQCTEALRTLIPELKSEDERIRKEIIQFIRDYHFDRLSNKVNIDTLELWAAWLEKQGEHKPVISDEAIREGVAHFGITQYQINNWLKKYINVEKQDEKNELRKIEQNPAWSDEDEQILKDTIYFLDTAKKHYASTEVLRSCIEWLKSLKGRIQSQCRPSEGRQTIAANKDTEGVFGLKKNGDLIHYSKVDAKDKGEYESIVIVKGHTCIKMALHNPKGEFTFDEAQKAAASLGEGWRCPTRHEWIDIYDSRFNGLDELIDKLGGDKINGWYWTCEDDADPQYSSTYSWFASNDGGVTNFPRRNSYRVCAVSAFQN